MEMSFLEKLIVNNRFYNYLYIKFILPRVLNIIDKNIKGNVLEIGCGIGKTTQAITVRFPSIKIIAVDYDKEQINMANKIFPLELKNRVKFIQGDGSDLKFKNNSFDAVFEFNAFHHIGSYEKAMSEVYRVLKDKGSFYVLDISKKFFNTLILKIDSGQALFSKEEFVKKLKEKDFTIRYSKHNYLFTVRAIKNAR